jgi:toxin YoeB
MEIDFTKTALSDLNKLKKSGTPTVQKKLSRILEEFKNTPYAGVGNPEALKHKYSGYWSRELTKKDRIIYAVDEQNKIVTVYQLLGHYFDK